MRIPPKEANATDVPVCVDCLVIAADAAGEIVRRASCGGTDALSYELVRDDILAVLRKSCCH